ncbi:acyl-CoA dehydrogenase [Streptomyces sp. NPDC093105]|uniref:acyl-CoA dehydrogenase family protein n=1 Tax=Streptomyces sp. NPDC093105 TaxID=3366029 RepID=UPI0037F2C44B
MALLTIQTQTPDPLTATPASTTGTAAAGTGTADTTAVGTITEAGTSGTTTKEVTTAPLTGELAETVAGELSDALFDGPDRDRIHTPWRDLVSRPAFRYRPHLTPDERTALSYARLRLVNAAVDDPEELALDARRLASLHEWTGFVDGGLCTLESIHYNLFLGSLLDHQPPHTPRDLSPYTSMARTGTFLCTELDHGNDAALLETIAELDPATGEFVLHTPTPGAQKFMPNTSTTGGPKTALVAARLLAGGQDHGVFLFLTPLSDENGHLPGIHVRPLPARAGTPVDHCLTAFDHVRLPPDALLEAAHGRLAPDGTFTSTLGNPRKRFLASISRVTTGKLCMSAGTLGMARAALAIAVRHAHTRHVSGTKPGQRIPVAHHRTHHSRLLNATATAYAMTFLHRHTLNRWAHRTADTTAETERLIAISKGWITWHARTIATEARERCGAQGLFPTNGLADLPSHIEGGITAEGDNLVIWTKAASEMIFGHTVTPPPRPTTHPETRPLTDLTLLTDLCAHTESIWQNRARTALRNGPPGNPLTRWNTASAPALELVAAHARTQAAHAFLTAITTTPDPTTRHLLEDLCRLFLLNELRNTTGDLLAHHLITPHHIHDLPQSIDTLTHTLAPHLPLLAGAFDLPHPHLADIPLTHTTPTHP